MKPCPYCATPIADRYTCCRDDECRAKQSATELKARRARRAERLAVRSVTPRRRLGAKATLLLHIRDEWMCHVCGMVTDRYADSKTPAAPVLDHVVPLALGGSNEEANLRTAHSYCNWSKGDRAPVSHIAPDD